MLLAAMTTAKMGRLMLPAPRAKLIKCVVAHMIISGVHDMGYV